MDLLTDHTFLEIFQELKFLPELFAVAHKPADIPRSYPGKLFRIWQCVPRVQIHRAVWFDAAIDGQPVVYKSTHGIRTACTSLCEICGIQHGTRAQISSTDIRRKDNAG